MKIASGHMHTGKKIISGDMIHIARAKRQQKLSSDPIGIVFSVPVREPRVSLSSARAGNIIGGGDWADDRIVPDCVPALVLGDPVEIRNRGQSDRGNLCLNRYSDICGLP